MTEVASAVAAAVDGRRVLRRLAELSRIGADPAGGMSRIAFSPADREALAVACTWLQDAGLTIAGDRYGNVFGSTDANAEGGRPHLCGSHLDTVPHGGTLDGALGVVAAIEAVEARRTIGLEATQPLEVVIWRCEEPVRYPQGKVGSLLFSGLLDEVALRPLDPSFDRDAALAADAVLPTRAERPPASCLELHIEQGRQLERAQRRLGVVTAVAAPIRVRICFEGRADHSGATPMDDRRDALCGAAELVLAVERAGVAEAAAGSVATCADAQVRAPAMNVVPGACEVRVDVRGIDLPSMERVLGEVGSAAGSIAARRGLIANVELLSRSDPTRFAAGVLAVLDQAVVLVGEQPLRVASGAGHDAQCVASMAPAGMLFVPSVDGVSHSPQEATADEDVVLGVRALAAAWTLLASDAQSG